MEPTRSRLKRLAFHALALTLSLVLAFVVAEVAAALLEPNQKVHGSVAAARHPELGWLPPAGQATVTTGEFTAHYDVNALGMNDRPIEESVHRSAVRILALGDSHTYAVGVSQQDAWPNALEGALYHGNLDAGTVYNSGVAGYSLGQYLVRYRTLADALKPQIVLIGFSMATDLYDLVPPRYGGFVYGSEAGRVYFDLDEAGRLVEVRDLAGTTIDAADIRANRSFSQRLRERLDRLALYRAVKKSGLAMAIAARGWRPGGESLWPGPDTAMRKTLGATESYRWRLAEAIVTTIAREAEARGARVLLVNIPYLPQVYDEVWQRSFGLRPDEFDRDIAGRRLAELCGRAGIGYVDTTPALVAEARRRGAWLHFRQDGHPTRDGQMIIAREVAQALVGQSFVVPPTTSSPHAVDRPIDH